MKKLKKSASKTPAQLDAEITEALAGYSPLKSTVTILTVTHIFRHSGVLSREQMFVFANRDRAIAAMDVHLTNSEAETTETTINIRTLDVIR